MINILHYSAFDEFDDAEEEMPYNENLVHSWFSENLLPVTTKIKTAVAQVDFQEKRDIQLVIPLDIDSGTEPAISITEMAIQNPGLFRTHIEVLLDTTKLFNGMRPDCISAGIKTNSLTNRKEAFLEFIFYD